MKCKFTDYKLVVCVNDLPHFLNKGYELIAQINSSVFLIAMRDCASCPTLCRQYQKDGIFTIETTTNRGF